MTQRFEGRNLDEALQHAAQAFGVERWKLNYHTLLEKRGFLGGVKRIVIEASVNEEAAPPPPPPAPLETHADVPPRRERASAPRSDAAGRGAGRGGSRGGSGGRERGQGREGRNGGRRGRGPHGGHNLRVGDFETFLGDVPEQGPESEAATAVREWCEKAIALSKLDLIVRTEENETEINVRLFGADSARMIDRHGELLDALQVLANKALVGRKTEKDIELDCEEFKQHRVDDLEARALAVAERVRSSGREELLPAMSPIERRIVHIALREDADVTTESRGDGFLKRVAVILRSDAEEKDEPQPAQES
jgi:spoIIIJ-associated protein